MLMDMCLPKFDIYQGTVAPNCFKSPTNSYVLIFFKKNVLPDVQSKMLLVQGNIVSIGQSARA